MMKVSVLMPSYNHEPFIAQAIESFLSQQCDFETELLIGDDCSTDNTLQIAKKYQLQYPEKIKLIAHAENQGLLKNYKSLIEKAQGEYLAILESDDYWTYDRKLQEQVDYLDAHPACGISFSRWERLRNGELALQPDESKKHQHYKDRIYESFLLWNNKIRATTACFRKCLFDKYCNIDDYISLGFQTIDYPVFISIIKHSEIHYMPFSTAVYRILNTSVSHNGDWEKAIGYQTGVEKMRQYIISLYGKGRVNNLQIIGRETYLKSRMALSYHKPALAFRYLFAETTGRSALAIHKELKIRIKDFRDFNKRFRMYSIFKKSSSPDQMVVLLVDGKYSHGGFCDRLKGIVSLYSYARARQLPFRIDYTFPFKLSDFLVPNEYNWLPAENEISRSFSDVKYICLVRDPSAKRLLRIQTNKQIHCHANRDIVDQLNHVYQTDFDWGQSFNSLFKPTEELSGLISFHKAQMNENYISAQFRFLNLLGDFKDNNNFRLPDDQKELLINKCLAAIQNLKKEYPGKKIFVASDSELFVERAAEIDEVYTLPGKVVHVDYVAGENHLVYLRVFLDFFLIAESEKVFALGTIQMYKTEFPMYAAKVNNIPFERIIIE